MTLADILLEDGVVVDLTATSKKGLIQELAQIAGARLNIDAREIWTAVLEREKLASTGVGLGVGIPHARLASVSHVCGVFARLVTPIEFDAIDDRPVDLAFLLLAPENAGVEHLKALARVSRALRRDELRRRLRQAPSADAMRAMLLESETLSAG